MCKLKDIHVHMVSSFCALLCPQLRPRMRLGSCCVSTSSPPSSWVLVDLEASAPHHMPRCSSVCLMYSTRQKNVSNSVQYNTVRFTQQAIETKRQQRARTILRKRRLPFRFVLFRSSIDNRYSRLSEVS